MFLSGFLLILGYIFLRPLRKFQKTTKINSSFQLISAMDCELVPLSPKKMKTSLALSHISHITILIRGLMIVSWMKNGIG